MRVREDVGGLLSGLGYKWARRWDFFFQAEDGIRDLVRSRGLGDVYKRQVHRFRTPGVSSRLHQLRDLRLARTRAYRRAHWELSLIHI